ncbi:SufD family Fe-S cluster assembly protein [Clostridium sp. E02]|uniref:SufB/SufD family protein n=1 Tax=Clostridium sp. E02 TaxID=2487134 RepID=UPI000F5288CB|nr:SufD family Fe-S cluster assembly protein [Clostridium sp. E02]
MNTQINRLPVPTWNRTGVNWIDGDASLPQRKLEKGKKEPFHATLPPHVTLMEQLPEDILAIKSAMGDPIDKFVLSGADKTCYLRAEGETPESVTIIQNLDETEPVCRTHFGIEAREGSQITVIQVNRGDAENGILANLTQIDAKKDAKVRLIQIQLLGDKSQGFDAVGARIGKGAKVELIRAIIGGKTSASGSYAYLDDTDGIYELSTAYYADKDQIFDFNDIAKHVGTNTVSNMNAAGILGGNSKKILRGTIDFRNGAVHSRGHENETVLLLSPKARNRTVPLILCGEESVEGQHAATLGRFDEKQLYYLCSRGLSPLQAKRMLVEARFSPVLNQLENEELRSEILLIIERRLNQYDNNPR